MNLLDILTAPWAIQPEKLVEIQDIYGRHLKGEKIDIAGIEARIGQPLQKGKQGYDVINGVAVIPVVGVIAKRMNMFSKISDGVSTQLVERDFADAMANPDVKAIILETDSPGGAVDGTSELGKRIYYSRGQKPIVTWANGLIASAAYWIGTAADQIYISSDTTKVGSIGVITRHVDYSKMDEKEGVKQTLIYAGKYKAVGADNAPLSDEDRAIIQADIDYLYSIFVDTVAKHRGVDAATVLDNMADGRIFTGQQAIDSGMVDGVATLEELIIALSDGDLPDMASFSAGALNKTEPEASTVNVVEQSTEIEPDQEAHTMPDKEITKGYVLENHADIAEDLRKEGRDSVDVAAAEANAAKAERERIQGVLAQSVAGCEDMINELAFDGKTTGPEAAVKVLAKIKDKRENAASNLHADGAELSAVKPSAEAGGASVISTDADADVDPEAPLEERAKAAWDKSAAIRSEYGGDYDAYLAFEKANENGQVRMISNRKG